MEFSESARSDRHAAINVLVRHAVADCLLDGIHHRVAQDIVLVGAINRRERHAVVPNLEGCPESKETLGVVLRDYSQHAINVLGDLF